jgi:hypothetical protein
VVVERSPEPGEQQLCRERAKTPQLLVEALGCAVRARSEKVGNLAPVDEPERLELAPQGRIERTHPANPLMVKRVMLRSEQDVEAEHALEEWRNGKRHVLLGVRRQRDPDHPILFSEEQLTDFRMAPMIAPCAKPSSPWHSPAHSSRFPASRRRRTRC